MNFSKICNKKIECRKQFEIITREFNPLESLTVMVELILVV